MTPGKQPLHIRERVLTGIGVEEVGARHVTEPVSQRGQPAQRAHVRGRERQARVALAQCRGREVEHEVMRAGGHDRALDLADAAEQPHRHLLAGVVPLELGRDHEQAVGPHE